MKLWGLMLWVVLVPSSVAADLTKQDLQEIQAMLDRHKADITQALEKQERVLKEYIDTKIGAVEAKFDAKIEAVRESVMTLQWAIGIIGILVVAILGAPQWITLSRERREARGDDRLTARLEEIKAELRREFEQKLQAGHTLS